MNANPILLPCKKCGDSVPIQRDDGQPVLCLSCAAEAVRLLGHPRRPARNMPARLGIAFARPVRLRIPIKWRAFAA